MYRISVDAAEGMIEAKLGGLMSLERLPPTLPS